MGYINGRSILEIFILTGSPSEMTCALLPRPLPPLLVRRRENRIEIIYDFGTWLGWDWTAKLGGRERWSNLYKGECNQPRMECVALRHLLSAQYHQQTLYRTFPNPLFFYILIHWTHFIQLHTKKDKTRPEAGGTAKGRIRINAIQNNNTHGISVLFQGG